jgi:hypothetical protein
MNYNFLNNFEISKLLLIIQIISMSEKLQTNSIFSVVLVFLCIFLRF